MMREDWGHLNAALLETGMLGVEIINSDGDAHAALITPLSSRALILHDDQIARAKAKAGDVGLIRAERPTKRLAIEALSAGKIGDKDADIKDAVDRHRLNFFQARFELGDYFADSSV